ncbi:MAG TPA: hypothetical protein VMR70_16340 [Flavisolibacter sp.]|nr:hypothetical protein [Flavisolibacter sp.]
MTCTFITAGLANISAQLAKLLRGLSVHAHDLCGRITDGGTFHIQLNTAGHHLDIILLKTG